MAIAAFVPEQMWVAISVVAVLFLLVVFDAVTSSKIFAGININFPETVQLAKDRKASLEVRIINPGRIGRELRIGIAWPLEISVPDDAISVLLPPGADVVSFQWQCTATKRGRYVLDKCFAETASRIGFWTFRRAFPMTCEVRVYPNLLAERTAALFLARGQFGAQAQRQAGKGRDFEKLRDYIPGDSFEDVHWKATARHGKPVTKIYQIERTQEVYVVIDASRLTSRNLDHSLRSTSRSHGRAAIEDIPVANSTQVENRAASSNVLERFITAGLVLGIAAERQGDLFGLLAFSDRMQRFVRAKNGKTHFGTCRDALFALQPETVTPDFDELFSFIRVHLRRRALLVFLTALDDPLLAENFVRNIDVISRQHLVIVGMIQPPGVQPLFSDPEVHSVDEIYQRLGGQILWNNSRELEKKLQRRGVRAILFDHEKLSAQLVTQYLETKRRQLL